MKTARVVGIVGACVVFVACSGSSDRTAGGGTSGSGAGGGTSGSGAGGGTSGSGAGGDASMIGGGGHEDGPGGSEATGGSTMGEAGTESGGTGGTIPPTCEEDCQESGQICDVNSLTCSCPPETPDHCSNDDVHCTNVMGDDDDHCGDCETACPETSVCNGGVCSALPEAIYVTSAPYISGLVLSGDTLYWSDTRVRSMAITGGPVTTWLQDADGPNFVMKLAVDSANLYALDDDGDDIPPSLYRIPLTGGSPKRIVTEKEPIFDFAVQAGVLYYGVGHEVKSVSADATDATGTVVASGGASEGMYGIAVDGPLLFWSLGAAQPPNSAPYAVEGNLISGGDRRTLGATQGSYYGQDSLTADGARVYWADGATLHRRVYDASTAQETVASARRPQITAFAVNATTAYFASSEPNAFNPGGRLEKVTFGAKPRGIARRQDVIRSLIAGESGLYWTSDGKIMRADL